MKFQSKNVVLFVAFVLIANLSSAQANLLNAKKVEDIGKKTEAQIDADNDKPLPYGYVDERDILWSVETWEIIDLNERVNFPLLFPIDTLDVSTYRRPLFDVIMKNVKNGKLDIYRDSHFAEKITLESIKASLTKEDLMDAGYDQLNAGEQVSEEYKIRRDLTAGDIAQYRVRGWWYFDKRQGELKYRILAIAPVAPDVNFIDSEDAQASLIELFWIFYPQAREILHEAKTFNRKNDAKPISFDHLLNARMFSGVIYKEANVYGDRPINEYLPGNSLFQLLESDKIKEKIRSREHDMWAN
ncbi:gliding motility protein GldN [Capnocytophaga canis]|uniref:Gliding motility-associated protein GldN n=1 Tax=Capnocytophaga canis TaxID=1848903 RepID=A0A0B7HWB1_9FLAO|nr:gliding motility protein GldN [Capnocytophaga canis]GIM61166.1 gliding motility protein GldO [Capnocytophaga canis]CEN42904.1 Gliding motility-associated protein GldN [Capnocytophaga canis]CEN45505.1 Gliding motility-associated protein GldN [Capnocytophaga canis]